MRRFFGYRAPQDRPAHRAAATWLLLAFFVGCVGPVRAESEAAVAERRIKAAFVSKFAEYVEWPATAFAQPGAPLTIAILGDDPMVEELRAILADRRLEGRGFDVRKLRDNETGHGVHVLFVGTSKRAALGPGVAPPTEAILVVTDFDGALAQGATINFLVKEARVRFEVSLVDAERRHLKLGSRLLTVAQNVRRGTE